MNKWVNSINHNRYVGNSIKKRNTQLVSQQLEDGNVAPLEPQGHYHFHWHRADRREDPDNISSSTKFILDGFQQANLIPNDNWEYIQSIHHYFYNDVPKGQEYTLIEVKYDE